MPSTGKTLALVPTDRSVAVESLFHRELNFGDIRGVVVTDGHRVVQIQFPRRPDDAVPIGLDPLEDGLMRFDERIIASLTRLVSKKVSQSTSHFSGDEVSK